MRRGNDIALLRQIAAIRHLQCAAAEGNAAQAATGLNAKKQVQDETQRQRAHVEEGWSNAVAGGPSFNPEVAGFWSTALLHEEEEVLQSTRDVAAAATQLNLRAMELHVATTRYETARDRTRNAVKLGLRRRDEIAAQEAADRHAQRWSAP